MVKSGKSGQKQAKVVGSSKSGLNSQKWFFRKNKNIFREKRMFCWPKFSFRNKKKL